MRGYILSFFLFSLASCTPENKIEIIKEPPPPVPQPSNCIQDDGLPKPRNPYYHGDTSKGVNTALINYYYPFIAQTWFTLSKTSKLNFSSAVFYDNRNDYIVERLSVISLPCTKDTIFIKGINSQTFTLDLPRAYYGYWEDDVPVEIFELDTTKRNYILITEYDTIRRVVYAEYWMQFKVEQPKQLKSSPDVVRFCDGKIKVNY